MVDRKKVKTRFKAENVRSAVADVMGMVRYSLRNLCTSWSIDLKTGREFIIVRMLVTTRCSLLNNIH